MYKTLVELTDKIFQLHNDDAKLEKVTFYRTDDPNNKDIGIMGIIDGTLYLKLEDFNRKEYLNGSLKDEIKEHYRYSFVVRTDMNTENDYYYRVYFSNKLPVFLETALSLEEYKQYVFLSNSHLTEYCFIISEKEFDIKIVDKESGFKETLLILLEMVDIIFSENKDEIALKNLRNKIRIYKSLL